MKNSTTNERRLPLWKRKAAWLALIPVLAIMFLAGVPQSQSSQANVKSMAKWAFIEGSWLATVTIPGDPPQIFPSPLSFCGGGALVCSDPSPFPNMTTAYHGTWDRKGPRTFVFTMTGYQYDATWPGDPGTYKLWRGIIKETVKIERDGESYNGGGTVTWYDPDGNQIGPFPDSTHAERIHAE